MNASVIQIGNSKGIRLPKSVIEKYNIAETVELILQKDQIVLKPVPKAREGWDKAFKKMRKNGDDKLLLPEVLPDENFDEWS